jgi:histone-arginine methyltransferase CARM1
LAYCDEQNFYGIDVTPFSDAAWEEVFSSPVVGCFGPLILLSASNNYDIDFLTITKENLKRFTIPLSFDVSQTAVVHGLAGWFDLHFLPPPPLSATGSGDPLTEEEMMALTPELDMKTAATATTTSNSDAIIDLGIGLGSEPLQAPPLVDPTISPSYMTTSPYATPTHWQQVRFLFQEPLAINKGQRIVGEMLCEVNDFR